MFKFKDMSLSYEQAAAYLTSDWSAKQAYKRDYELEGCVLCILDEAKRLREDRDSLREQLARANELSEQRLVEATEYMFQVSHLNDRLRLATESLFAAASDLDWCAVKLSYAGTRDSFTHANSCFEKALSSLGLSQSQYADVYEASENEESVFDAIVAQALAPQKTTIAFHNPVTKEDLSSEATLAQLVRDETKLRLRWGNEGYERRLKDLEDRIASRAMNPKDSTEALKRSDRDRLVIAVEALQSLTRALAQSNEEWLKATLKMTLKAIGPLDGSSK